MNSPEIIENTIFPLFLGRTKTQNPVISDTQPAVKNIDITFT